MMGARISRNSSQGFVLCTSREGMDDCGRLNGVVDVVIVLKRLNIMILA